MSIFANGYQAFTARLYLHMTFLSRWTAFHWRRGLYQKGAGVDQNEYFASLHRTRMRTPLDADTSYLLTVANMHRTNLLK